LKPKNLSDFRFLTIRQIRTLLRGSTNVGSNSDRHEAAPAHKLDTNGPALGVRSLFGGAQHPRKSNHQNPHQGS
jgi:hypothetical protein